MSTGLPWKLYLALEGEPRQLIDAFVTFREAAGAFAEIVGAAGALRFSVTVEVRPQASYATTTRFVYDSRATPYVIELVE